MGGGVNVGLSCGVTGLLSWEGELDLGIGVNVTAVELENSSGSAWDVA